MVLEPVLDWGINKRKNLVYKIQTEMESWKKSVIKCETSRWEQLVHIFLIICRNNPG